MYIDNYNRYMSENNNMSNLEIDSSQNIGSDGYRKNQTGEFDFDSSLD